MSKDHSEKTKQENSQDLKRAGQSRKKDQSSVSGSRIQNSPAATRRARKDADATRRTTSSWIVRERALASGSPGLSELLIATVHIVGRTVARLGERG